MAVAQTLGWEQRNRLLGVLHLRTGHMGDSAESVPLKREQLWGTQGHDAFKEVSRARHPLPCNEDSRLANLGTLVRDWQVRDAGNVAVRMLGRATESGI